MRHITLVGSTSTNITIFPNLPLKAPSPCRLPMLNLNNLNVEHAPYLQFFPTFITNVDHSSIHARTHLCDLRLCRKCKCVSTFPSPLDPHIVVGVGLLPLCRRYLSKATAPRLAQPPNSAVGDRHGSYQLKYLGCSVEVQQSSQPYCLL